MLEVQNIRLEMGGREILRGISLSLPIPSLYCLMGPNGAGKSLLLEIIAGLRKPTSGRVVWKGKSILELSPAERARKLGFLPQRSEFFSPFPVEEVVKTGCFAKRKCDAERAMEEAGVFHLRSREFTSLSEGERKLVLIAKVLAQATELLLLDEPASNLDLSNQVKIYSLLSKISRQKTVLTTEHNIFLSGFCKRIFFIKEGKIIVQGRTEEVMNGKNIERVYGAAPGFLPFSLNPEGFLGKEAYIKAPGKEAGFSLSGHNR